MSLEKHENIQTQEYNRLLSETKISRTELTRRYQKRIQENVGTCDWKIENDKDTMSRKIMKFLRNRKNNVPRNIAKSITFRLIRNLAYFMNVDSLNEGDRVRINFKTDTLKISKNDEIREIKNILFGSEKQIEDQIKDNAIDALEGAKEEQIEDALEESSIYTIYLLFGCKPRNFWRTYSQHIRYFQRHNSSKNFFVDEDGKALLPIKSRDVRQASVKLQREYAEAMKESLRLIYEKGGMDRSEPLIKQIDEILEIPKNVRAARVRARRRGPGGRPRTGGPGARPRTGS